MANFTTLDLGVQTTDLGSFVVETMPEPADSANASTLNCLTVSLDECASLGASYQDVWVDARWSEFASHIP